MKNIAWFEDVFRPDIPGVEQLQERDLHGRNASTLCLNNPGYRNFLLALVEDYTRSWDLDGIMWGSERQGAFANALGSQPRRRTRRSRPRDLLLRFLPRRRPPSKASASNARAAGFLELEKFVRASRARAIARSMVTMSSSGGLC